MSTNQGKKFTLSTDTDLHMDMLADHSKLKIFPNVVENKDNNISISGDGKSDESDDIIDNEVNSDSLKFNESSDEEDKTNDTHDKTDYNKQKMLHDYQKQVKENRYKDRISEEDEETSKKNTEENKKVTLTELNNMDEVPFHMLDSQTQKFKKMEKYAELLAIKNTGIKLTKEYSFNSDYEEMCFEVKYWSNFQKKKDAVNLGKNFMMNAITAIEFMNERYDPFGLKLKGWSDQMQIGLEGYDPVFSQLYEKYKGSGREMAPEIKLILMISASAVSFHASKKMAESLPGLDKVLESNPELLSKLQGTINENISKTKSNPEVTDSESKRKMYDQMQKLKKQQAKFEELKQKQNDIQENTDRLQEQLNKNNKPNVVNNNGGIQNILEKIRAQNAVNDADNVLNNSNTSDSSERVSVKSTLGHEDSSNNSSSKNETLTLGSDGKPKRKKKNGKPTISITT